MTVVYSGASDERDHWEQGLLKRFRENPEALRLAEEAGLRAEHFQYEVNAEAFLDFKQRRHPGKGRPIDECERVGLVGEVLGLMGITGEGSYGAAPDRTTPRGQHDTKRNAAKAKPAAPANDRQIRRQGNSATREHPAPDPDAKAKDLGKRRRKATLPGHRRPEWMGKIGEHIDAGSLTYFDAYVASRLQWVSMDNDTGETRYGVKKLFATSKATSKGIGNSLARLCAAGFLFEIEKNKSYRLTFPDEEKPEAAARSADSSKRKQKPPAPEPAPAVPEPAPAEMDDPYRYRVTDRDDEIPF